MHLEKWEIFFFQFKLFNLLKKSISQEWMNTKPIIDDVIDIKVKFVNWNGEKHKTVFRKSRSVFIYKIVT